MCCVRVVRWGWLGQMVGTPYGGVVGWFHAGVRPWGLSALLLAVGFPCPLGLVGVRPLCVGGFPGAGGGLDLMPVGRGGCWW